MLTVGLSVLTKMPAESECLSKLVCDFVFYIMTEQYTMTMRPYSGLSGSEVPSRTVKTGKQTTIPTPPDPEEPKDGQGSIV